MVKNNELFILSKMKFIYCVGVNNELRKLVNEKLADRLK